MLGLLGFWIALALPGYVLLSLVAREELDAGPLPAIAASYLASFGLLVPWLVLVYWAELPVAWLSGYLLALLLGSLVVGVRKRLWRTGRAPLEGMLVVGVAAVLFHLWSAQRVGSWLEGDATFHVARVRHFLDHGVSNLDIFVNTRHPNGYYHTSLLHALLASACQLTGLPPLELWHASLPWARLLVAAGHAYLASAVFGGRSAGWIAAAFALTTQAGVTYMLYPNILAGGFVLPVLLGVVLRAAASEPSLRAPIKLACGVVTASLLHALYPVLLGVCLVGPLLYGAARALQQRHRLREISLCTSALALGVPGALLVLHTDAGPAFQPPPPMQPPMSTAQMTDMVEAARWRWLRLRGGHAAPAAENEKAGGGPLEKHLQQAEDGRYALEVDDLGGAPFVLLSLLGLAYAIYARPERRPAAIGLALALAMPGAVLLLPALCTAAVSLAGAPYLVVRLTPLVSTCLFTALAGALACAVKQPGGRRLLPECLVLAAAVAGTQLRGHAPRRWQTHVERALAPPNERLQELYEAQQGRALLREHVPARATVLSTLRLARHVVMLHDLYVVAADRGHASIRGLPRRRVDVVRMTERGLPWPQRRQLLQHYGVRYVVSLRHEAPLYSWLRAHGKLLGERGKWRVHRLEFD